MKEHPILFSAPMVRALLAGTKTQTRRAWRVQPPPGVRIGWVTGQSTTPYGKEGDRLWVREAFRLTADFDKDAPSFVGDRCLDAGYLKPWAPIKFEADGRCDNWRCVGTIPGAAVAGKLRPGIHMPRWASRITLEITSVRVERLQDISDADALAEGITLEAGMFFNGSETEFDMPRDAYAALWESINGAGSWDANPWVWCLSFKRLA